MLLGRARAKGKGKTKRKGKIGVGRAAEVGVEDGRRLRHGGRLWSEAGEGMVRLHGPTIRTHWHITQLKTWQRWGKFATLIYAVG